MVFNPMMLKLYLWYFGDLYCKHYGPRSDLGLFQKKIPRGGRRQTIYFSMGGGCKHFSNYIGHWCLKKSDYTGGGVLSENRLLMFDRYIKSIVPVSIKISNPNLPVFLLCEIIQSTHKLIYFV